MSVEDNLRGVSCQQETGSPDSLPIGGPKAQEASSPRRPLDVLFAMRHAQDHGQTNYSRRRVARALRHVFLLPAASVVDHDRAKRIVLGVLNSQLAGRDAACVGFVVMPDHVHAIVWFPRPGQLSVFMQQWKRLSSHHIGQWVRAELTRYAARIGPDDPFWWATYHSFTLLVTFTRRKAIPARHFFRDAVSEHQKGVVAGG